MSLRDEIVDVAGHDDRDTKLVVERHCGARDHGASLPALNSPVNQAGDRMVGNSVEVDVAVRRNAIGVNHGVYDIGRVSLGIASLIAVETEGVERGGKM